MADHPPVSIPFSPQEIGLAVFTWRLKNRSRQPSRPIAVKLRPRRSDGEIRAAPEFGGPGSAKRPLGHGGGTSQRAMRPNSAMKSALRSGISCAGLFVIYPSGEFP